MFRQLFETKVGFILEDPLSRILLNIYISDIPILPKNPHFGEKLTLANHEKDFLFFHVNLTTRELSEQDRLSKINVLKHYCQQWT